jgi:Cu/Ag efflux pump CusA
MSLGGIAIGSDIDGYVRAAAQRIDEQGKFPPGCYIQWAGQFQHLKEAEQRLAVFDSAGR